MKSLSDFKILPQPNETTCGPTCLQAVYRFFGEELSLDQVIADTSVLEDGGTLGVLLGAQALQRGYRVTIFTYNLRVFDPSWFEPPVLHENLEPVSGANPSFNFIKSTMERAAWRLRRARTKPPRCVERLPIVDLIDKLDRQARAKDSIKLQMACKAYADFITNGGRVVMHELNKSLLRHFLDRSCPILTGLSATYLYQAARERQRDMKPDDVRGTPTGHFVVLSGYTPRTKRFRVADPYLPNPFTSDHYYDVDSDRLINAILLGVLTYDSNLLIIEPPEDVT